MYKLFLIFLLFLPCGARATTETLDMAIATVRENCIGISDEMGHLKTMAGINTAVTGVGMVAGGVAVGTGLAKVGVDKDAENLEKELERLRDLAATQDVAELSDIPMDGPIVELDFDISTVPDDALTPVTQQDIATAEAELAKLESKSKRLGNWRTGTLAVNTATNVAGTVIAANNKVKGDLRDQINLCIMSVDALSRAYMQTRLEPEADKTQLGYAQQIVTICGAWAGVDISAINSKARGATISSGIGSGVGLAGTIASAVANTNATRQDNTAGGRQKEKNLNTAANIMAGGATVASGVATVFNATQISAIKKAVAVADSCEGVFR